MTGGLLKKLFFVQILILATCLSTARISVASVSQENAELETKEQFLQLACSDWKPYCYQENAQVVGQIIDVSKSIVNTAEFEYTLELLPWKRVYQQGLKTPNFLILGLGRTAKREKLFKWIAPIKKPSNIFAYKKVDSDITVKNVADLSQYDIAVERGSYMHDFLVLNGHDENKIILVARYAQLYNMVKNNRAQLFLMDSKVFRPEALRNNFSPDDFKPTIRAIVDTEYLATGLNTSDAVVNRLKRSYEKLSSSSQLSLPD